MISSCDAFLFRLSREWTFFRGAGGEVCFVTGRFLRGCSLLQWLQGLDPPTGSVKTNCCFAFALARTKCGCCLGELERFVCLLTCVSVNPCIRNTDAQATATACCQSISFKFVHPPSSPLVLLQTFSLAFLSLFVGSGLGPRLVALAQLISFVFLKSERPFHFGFLE